MIRKNYMINQNLMYMVNYNDRNGKPCSLVRERKLIFLVDRSPLEIMNDSITQIGFDLRGAITASKEILGDIHMCPIMVNPLKGICLFPTKSAKHEEAIWINPAHVAWTHYHNQKTEVIFKNGHTFLLPTKLSSFNTKLQYAMQLKDFTVASAQNPKSINVKKKKKRASR